MPALRWLKPKPCWPRFRLPENIQAQIFDGCELVSTALDEQLEEQSWTTTNWQSKRPAAPANMDQSRRRFKVKCKPRLRSMPLVLRHPNRKESVRLRNNSAPKLSTRSLRLSVK